MVRKQQPGCPQVSNRLRRQRPQQQPLGTGFALGRPEPSDRSGGRIIKGRRHKLPIGAVNHGIAIGDFSPCDGTASHADKSASCFAEIVGMIIPPSKTAYQCHPTCHALWIAALKNACWISAATLASFASSDATSCATRTRSAASGAWAAAA